MKEEATRTHHLVAALHRTELDDGAGMVGL
jgi:hypothetical protein